MYQSKKDVKNKEKELIKELMVNAKVYQPKKSIKLNQSEIFETIKKTKK
jgi:hypothetical protein